MSRHVKETRCLFLPFFSSSFFSLSLSCLLFLCIYFCKMAASTHSESDTTSNTLSSGFIFGCCCCCCFFLPKRNEIRLLQRSCHCFPSETSITDVSITNEKICASLLRCHFQGQRTIRRRLSPCSCSVIDPLFMRRQSIDRVDAQEK